MIEVQFKYTLIKTEKINIPPKVILAESNGCLSKK